MFKNRTIQYIFIIIICVSLAGCASLQRKFTRKKKKEERVTPVITTFDYSKDLRVDELYKKHFLFWQSWHSELIGRMDASYKKRSECFDYTVESLKEMKKYLSDSKAKELKPFMEEVASIRADIKKKRLLKSEKYKMRQLLERTKRDISKRFSYNDVKDFLQY